MSEKQPRIRSIVLVVNRVHMQMRGSGSRNARNVNSIDVPTCIRENSAGSLARLWTVSHLLVLPLTPKKASPEYPQSAETAIIFFVLPKWLVILHFCRPRARFSLYYPAELGSLRCSSVDFTSWLRRCT
jgi:hypothetical protein